MPGDNRSFQEVQNLASLHKFDEDEIVELVLKRCMLDKIYTFAGPTLVAVNPDREVDIYTPEEKEKAKETPAQPHIYLVAERAYSGAASGRPQVVVLSGDSGSGKTVNAGHLLEYLSSRTHAGYLGKKLQHAGPLLEVFGNACTKNNSNSSRFGKYVELRYESTDLVDARIDVFLLEKTRVLQKQGSFHIVQTVQALLSGGDTPCLKKMHGILCHFYELGVPKSAVLQIFRAVFGIVHLLVMEIGEKNGLAVIDEHAAAKAAVALGTCPRKIQSELQEKVLVMGRETIRKGYTKEQAENKRNTLVRAAYETMFFKLVLAINTALLAPARSDELLEYLNDPEMEIFMSDLLDAQAEKAEETPAVQETGYSSMHKTGATVGILDIYGFETMEKNGLDQLCINYANEKIQAEYAKMVLEDNAQALREEGISLEPGLCSTNAVQTFEGDFGIIEMLDEESFLPCGSTFSWIQKIQRLSHIKKAGENIQVKHYAGCVEYVPHDFVRQNRNEYGTTYEILNGTSNSILHTEKSYKGMLSTTGIMGEYRESMQALLERIAGSNIQYVRCMKLPPKRGIEKEHLKNQLRYAGVFETVRIYMLGYYTKMTHAEYQLEYGSCTPAAEKAGAKKGRKYIFLTEQAYKYLESERVQKNLKERAAGTVQVLARHILRLQRIRREIEKRIDTPSKKDEMMSCTNSAQTEITLQLQPSRDSPVSAKETVQTKEAPQSCETPHVDASGPSSSCSKCSLIQQKYNCQLKYLAALTKEISQLQSDLDKAQRALQEKEQLVVELGGKMEAVLLKISNNDTYDRKNPIVSTLPATPKPTDENSDSFREACRQVCRMYAQTASAPESGAPKNPVHCAYALYRMAVTAKGNRIRNQEVAVRTFQVVAHSILHANVSSMADLASFLLANAIFFARVMPGPLTSDVLQGVFGDSCRSLAEDVVGMGLDCLCQSSTAGRSGIFQRFLHKASIEEVCGRIKKIMSCLSENQVPRGVASAVLELVLQLIDRAGFDCVTGKGKKITKKNLCHLAENLSILSAEATRMGLPAPGSKYFPCLHELPALAAIGNSKVGKDSATLSLGVLSMHQAKAAVTALVPEIKSKGLQRLRNALETADKRAGSSQEEILPLTQTVLAVPLDEQEPNMDQVHASLLASSEITDIYEVLKRCSMQTEWMS